MSLVKASIPSPRYRLTLEPLEDRTLMSTCHVTRLGDVGAGMGFRGDLRYCINKVNAEPGADAIEFRVAGTINLGGALPELSSEIDIQGPGADLLTVRRNTGGDYRIFRIPSGNSVRISGIAIANGRVFNEPNEVGGGIFNSGTLALSDCVVSRNRATGAGGVAGGGIMNGPEGVMTIHNTSVIGNVAEDLIEDAASGGGIRNMGSLTITNSTISGNWTAAPYSGALGGGIYNTGTLIVAHSTITGNIAYQDDGSGGLGGGLYHSGSNPLIIHHSTIAQNIGQGGGGGIHGTVTSMHNTILAKNGIDLSGTILSSGRNLIGNSVGGSGYAPSDILDVDPKFGSLADNGGPTLTMALLPGSPAIDAGDNADAPEFDQRGPGFPRIVNGTIDIGAFEVQSTGAPSISRPSSAPWMDVLSVVLATADFDLFA